MSLLCSITIFSERVRSVGGSLQVAKLFGGAERSCVSGPSLIQASHTSVVGKKKKGLKKAIDAQWESCTAAIPHTTKASCYKTSCSHMSYV